MRRLGFLVLLLLVGCGQEGAGIGQSASAALDPQVQQVRAAATRGDRAGAARELAELRQTVADLRQRRELTESAAAKVLAAAAEVEARLEAGITPATQVTPTTSGQRDTSRTAREAEEEARKRAEEAAKKAEEEAKKRADEAKKRAEEGKKD
ncbi:MAG TPA: hypothetical protein VGV86_13500 [Acidimicrobiales bacterium]|nr:hypothetical protein [Acidimicrobiales bacterium]